MNRRMSPALAVIWRGVSASALLTWLVVSVPALANDVPQSFSLDGRLYADTAATRPLIDDNIDVKVQILNEEKSCLLYEENHAISTVPSMGYFNVRVGSVLGDIKRTVGIDPGLTMSQVFSNVTSVTGRAVSGGAPCVVSPVAGKRRFARVIVSPATLGSVPRTLVPDLAIDSVPNAVVAERAESIQGFRENQLLKVNATAGNVLTQSNLESLFSSTTRYNAVSALADGTSSMYIRSSTTGAQLPLIAGAPPSTPGTGSIWFDSTDNKIKFQAPGGPLTLTDGTVTSSQWITNSTNIYYNTGNVGIGTTTPTSRLQVVGANSTVGAAPSVLSIAGGTSTVSTGGGVSISAGGGEGGGSVSISAGGDIVSGGSGAGGSLQLSGAGTVGQPGGVNLTAGLGGNGYGHGGSLVLPSAGSANGGNVSLLAGSGQSTNSDGGSIYIAAGAKAGTGTDGNVILGHNGTSANGNVGIGTTTPGGILEVQGGTSASGNGTSIVMQSQNGAVAGGAGGGFGFFTGAGNVSNRPGGFGINNNLVGSTYIFKADTNGGFDGNQRFAGFEYSYPGSSHLALNIIRTKPGLNLTSGDVIGELRFVGRDNTGTGLTSGAIVVGSEGAVSTGVLPTHMIFYTTNSGAPSATEKMRISSAGNVGIGITSANTTLDVNGAFSMREMSAPSVSPTDQGRIYFDSTANKFRVSENGGSFVDLVGSATASGTAGHIQFSNGSGGFSSDSSRLFWDAANDRLGIGTSSPGTMLDIAGSNREIRFSGDGSTDGTVSYNFSGSTWSSIDLFDTVSLNATGNNNFIVNKSGTGNGDYMLGVPNGASRTVEFRDLAGGWSAANIVVNKTAGSNANGTMLLKTTGHSVNQLFLDAVGNVSIGTTTPGAQFHVNDVGSGASVKFQSANGSSYILHDYQIGSSFGSGSYRWQANTGAVGMLELGHGSTLTKYFTVDGPNARVFFPNGNVGVGVSNPSTKFQVAGVISPAADATHTLGSASLRFSDVYSVNSANNTSDRREKSQINDSDLGLNFINKLRPVSYLWKSGSDSVQHYGLIAQDTQRAIAESKAHSVEKHESPIVTYDESSDRFGIRYTELIAPLIKAVQELYQKLENMERSIASAMSEKADRDSLDRANLKIRQLESENAAIKNYICEKEPKADLCK